MKEFYSNEKKLNWVKVIIVVLIVLAIIGITLFFVLRKRNENKPMVNVLTTDLFIDNGNSVCLKLPKSYNLSTFTSDTNHLISLHSPEDLYILVSYEPVFAGHSLTDIITSDRDHNVSAFDTTSNVTEVKNEKINNLDIYTYSFDYNSDGKDHSLNTFWISNSYGYYIIDVYYLKENEGNYVSLFDDILNSFTILEKDTNTDLSEEEQQQ